MRVVSLLLILCCFAPMAVAAGSMYRCEIGGVATYSDRPCGADAQPHELDDGAISTYTPPPTPRSPPVKARSLRSSGTPRAAADNDVAKQAELCARLNRSRKEVHSKMRAGYKAKEGERLRERLAKLKAQSAEARCK